MGTSAPNSSTPGAALRGPLPWLTLALLVILLAGAFLSWWGLSRLRAPLEFETLRAVPVGRQVEAGEAEPIPVDRVRLRERPRYPVHFLLLHGYAANRRQLRQLAEVLATAGAEVYVPDLPGRGDHPGRATPRAPGSLPAPACRQAEQAGFNARMETPRETRAALDVAHHLQRAYGVARDRLVVVGHSMGGGVALEVGQRLLPAATISLSGLERSVAPGRPPHPLFITARLDLPPLRRAADRMHERAGNAAGREEFLITHSWLPFHSGAQQAIVDWANRAVPEARLSVPPLLNEKLLALDLAGLFFLVALFAPLASLAGWALRPEPFGEIVPETRLSTWSPLHLLGYALVVGLTVVTVIHLLKLAGWSHPLSFLHLEGGYLPSLLLLSTAGLLPALWRQPWVRNWRETGLKVSVALALAAYVVVAGGGFVTWQLYDLWPTPARLAKLLLLVPLLFPYALGEELLVRTFSKRHRGGTALSAFLLWRLALLASILFGVLVFTSGQGMLVVLAVPLLLLSVVEYYFAQALYRSVASAYANAVLKAVLLAWIFATVFPLQ